jgi:hypothetical protein
MRLAKWGNTLRTRHLGMQIRAEAEKELAMAGNLVLDFAGVEALSHSFADELIGKLAAGMGKERTQSDLRFRNAQAHIRPLIQHVVANRLQMAKSSEHKFA